MAAGNKKLKLPQRWDLPDDAPEYLHDALKDLGLKEWTIEDGKKVSNPAVERFIEKVNGKRLDAIKTPWCAFWLGAKLEYHKISSTKSGMARSYVRFGDKIAWEDDFNLVMPGDIVVFWRGRHDDGIKGHVAFFLDFVEEGVVCLGANQGDTVSIEVFDTNKILAIVRPRPATASKTIKAAVKAAASETTNTFVSQMIPEPSSVKAVAADKALETINSIKGPVEALSSIKPWLTGLLSAMTIFFILYAAYHRFNDHKNGRNN